MSTRIGLMGFGRIGRNIFRILHGHPRLEVVAISEIVPFETAAYLLRWDTVHGPFPDSVELHQDRLLVAGREVRLVAAEHPNKVDWSQFDVDIVIDATTKFRTRTELNQHLESGPKNVILTVPPDDDDIDIVVLGANGEVLERKPDIVSGGSVTISCLAPLLRILDQAYGVKRAAMTTVHAYTSAQRLADVPAGDFRTSRSAAENIIPAPTSAAEVLARVLPNFANKLHAIAMNVPVPDGSIIDLVTETERDADREHVNQLIKSAAGSEEYGRYLQYTDDAIVSSDIIGNPHSAIFDSRSTRVLGSNLLKTLTWFDNGWGYASRIVEIADQMATWQ